MMHFLRRMFIAGCACAVALVGLVFVVYHYRAGLLVDIRNAHLCRDAESSELFVAAPDELVAMGFQLDSEAEVGEFRARYFDKISCLRELPADFEALDTLGRAKALASVMSAGGLCDYFTDSTTLYEKLQRMPSGSGLCSDHAEGFIALCRLYGIFAAEVSASVHTVAQVWCPESGRWAVIDPEGCILPIGAAGRPLDALELRDAYLGGKPVYWEFFGETERHTVCTRWDEIGNFDDTSDMHELMLTFGANVFEVDRVRRGLRWVPKIARQLYYRAVGLMPEYVLLSDGYTARGAYYGRIRGWTYAAVAAFAVALGAYPLALLARRFARPSDDSDSRGGSRRRERDELPAEVPSLLLKRSA